MDTAYSHKITYAKKWWKTYTYVTKNYFYKQLKQSMSYAFRIKELLSAYPYVKIVPIIVFAGDAVLSNIESNRHVIYENDILEVIDGYKTTYLTDNDVQAVCFQYSVGAMSDTLTDWQHIKNLKTTAREVNAIISRVSVRNVVAALLNDEESTVHSMDTPAILSVNS